MAEKIFVASMKHELGSFVDGLLTKDIIRDSLEWFHGQDVIDRYGPSDSIDIAGVMHEARRHGMEIIPSLYVRAGAGPPVCDLAHQEMAEQIMSDLSACRGAIDGVMLVLHGAMGTPSCDDPEGELISRVRECVGPDIPIVVSLDCHALLTEAMVRGADALVAYRTNPHVDSYETGVRAMRILAGAVRRKIKPIISYRTIRMLSTAQTHDTSKGPMAEIIAHLDEAQRTNDKILDTSFIAITPWLDLPGMCWAPIVITDGAPEVGQALADEVATMAWGMRERFLYQNRVPVDEALDRVEADGGGPHILVDSSDNINGGSYGDGPFLLRALLERGYTGRALLTITDPDAARACAQAGVGSDIEVDVGGKLVPQFYPPVPIKGTITTLSNGDFVTYQRRLLRRGLTAVVAVGGIHVVISELKAPMVCQAVYLSLGLDPRTADIVQVKSGIGFRPFYESIAKSIIDLDFPGPTDSNLERLPYRRITRPIWPLDRDLDAPW